MIFSLIAGWLTKRIWPVGILIVLGISVASALIGFLQDEAVNSNRDALGLALRPNGAGIVLEGFVIDAVTNFVLFLIMWGLRRKFRPHAEKPDLK